MEPANYKKHRFPPLRKDGAYNGRMAAAVAGAVAGLITGTLPAVIWALISGGRAYALHAACPLAMCLFIVIFKGCRDVRACILTAVMSLPGAYLTYVSAQAAIYASLYGMPPLSVPLVALTSAVRAELLPDTAADWLYPLTFAATGWLLSCVILLRAGKKTR